MAGSATRGTGKGRYASAKAAKMRGAKALPPRRGGKARITRGNPLAHGGNGLRKYS